MFINTSTTSDLPLSDRMVEPSSPLSSSLSICGNERPKQNSGSVDSGSLDASISCAGQVGWSRVSAIDFVSLLFDDIRFSAYLLFTLFLLISSRRLRPHLGDPSGLISSLVWPLDIESKLLGCCWPIGSGDAGPPGPWKKVRSSSGTRLMACSTPTSSVCKRWGSSSANISRAMGVRPSRFCGLSGRYVTSVRLKAERHTAHNCTVDPDS